MNLQDPVYIIEGVQAKKKNLKKYNCIAQST